MPRLSKTKIVGLVFAFAIGLASVVWGIADFLKSPDSASWKQTGGKIVRVWQNERRSRRNVFAEFEYEVNGHKYSSSTYRFLENEFPFDTKVGQDVTAFYLPDDPAVAVLDKRKPTTKLFTALAIIGVLCFGMIAAIFAPDRRDS